MQGRHLIQFVIPRVDLHHILAPHPTHTSVNVSSCGDSTGGSAISKSVSFCSKLCSLTGTQLVYGSPHQHQSEFSLSVTTFLWGSSLVTSSHIKPTSPRGRVGQRNQSPCLGSSHSSESEGSLQLSVSVSCPAGLPCTS